MEIRIPPDLTVDDLEEFPQEGFRYELAYRQAAVTTLSELEKAG